MTTTPLEARIARVLVRATHPELTPAKIDQLVTLGVGCATARLLIIELDLENLIASATMYEAR